MSTPISATLKQLSRSQLVGKAIPTGCTAAEIEDLERKCGVRLPATYREFLAKCGNGFGDFLCGTCWTSADLAQIQGLSRRLFEKKCIGGEWNESWFVFAMHQGYQFLFFDTRNGRDPPVLHFLDSEGAPRKVFDTFSDWFSQCANDEIACYDQMS